LPLPPPFAPSFIGLEYSRDITDWNQKGRPFARPI
jgi:hypothetical protein